MVIFPQYAMSWPKTSSQVKPTPWWSGSQTRQRKISHLMFVPWKWPSLGFPANEALDDTGGIQRKRLQTIASQHGNPFVCTMTKPSMYLHMLAPWYLGKIDSHDIWARLLLTHITLHEKAALITRLWLALLWLDINPSLSSHIPIYTSKYIKYYLRISQYFKISKWVHCISITYHKLSIFVQYYPMIINGIVSLFLSILFNKLYSYPLIPPLPLVSVQGGTGRAIYRSVHMSLTSPGTVERKGWFCW
jgi:hypothetical protein